MSAKGHQDWVTETDRLVEQLLHDRLIAAFPQDGFVGEEQGTRRSGALCWVVDPIDGTANFARGGGRWCVSIGLLADGLPVAGVLCAPVVRELYDAWAGHGARLNGETIRVAETDSLDRALVEFGGWSSPRAFLRICDQVMAAGAAPRAGGSAALALAEVSCGRLDAYVQSDIHTWDVAGALSILSEAGGVDNGFFAARLRDGGQVGPVIGAVPGIADALQKTLGW